MRSRPVRIIVLVAALAAGLLAVPAGPGSTPDAAAHRDGCHRWHSCPSDTGSYVCGDMGYDSECGGLSDDSSAYDDDLYGDEDLYGSDGSYDSGEDAAIDPGPDPYELGRQRAQDRLAAAQAKLAAAKAAVAPARRAARAAERVARRRRDVADAADARASRAEGAVAAAGRTMIRQRRAAARRVRSGEKAHARNVRRWKADRQARLLLAIALLVLAILVGLHGRLRDGVARLRRQGITGGQYAAIAVALTVVSLVVFSWLSDALGAGESDDAGGAAALMLVALPLLAWLAWRGTCPERDEPRWRRLRGARHYPTVIAAGTVILAVVTVLAARSTTRPAPARASAEDVRLAALAGSDTPTAELTSLRTSAQALRDRADRAAARAASADSRAAEATDSLDRARGRMSKAAKSVKHWERKVEDPDPVFADDLSE